MKPVSFSPSIDIFINRGDVTLQSNTSGAQIFYETNDFLQLSQNSKEYTEPFTINCAGSVWNCEFTVRAKVRIKSFFYTSNFNQ